LILAAAVVQAASFDPKIAGVEGLESGKLYLQAGTFEVDRIENLLAQPNPKFGADQSYVVQLDGPMTTERRTALEGAGVLLQSYLPQHAYIAQLGFAEPNALAALPFVRWVGSYRSDWKIDPGIGQRLTPFQTDLRIAVERAGLVKLTVTLFEGRGLEEGMRGLAGLGAMVLDGIDVGGQGMIEVILDPADLAAAAERSDVQYIEEASEITLRNMTTRWIVQSNVNGVTPLYANGITGLGQLAGIIDGKVNVNHCSFFDSDPIGPLHRKIQAYNTSLGSDTHGTHVAGTTVGDDGTTNNTRGIAYGGRFCYNTIPSFTEAMILSRLTLHHDQGARMHTNSWGDDGTTVYNSLCRGIDLFSYNFEDDLVFFAVTNLGSLRNPENAKNLLAVGASQDTPSQQNHCSGGAGPTTDGRRKPEIYAPGCSTNSSNGSGCSTVALTGTSMASPAVAGVGMLVRQYYQDGFFPTGAANPTDALNPSAALVKATLLNASVDMTGVAGYPSNTEGWGRVLADRALYFAGDARTLIVLDDIRNASGFTTGGSAAYPVTVTNPAEQLRVTLVWTDPPAAAGASQAAINDLDLVVISPGGSSTYLGNVFSAGASATGGVKDAKNNVEQVHVNSPATGVWTVSVNAAAVNVGTQGYALIVTGAVALDPTCNDGVLNQDEVLIDCGGVCPPCECLTDDECLDTLYCNGVETCSESGQCTAGADPCTDPDLPFCVEESDSCIQCLTGGDCDDGLFCTGVETCDVNGSCQPGTDPCTDPDEPICDAASGTCVQCLVDADCDDDDDCTVEVCNHSPAGCEYTSLVILFADVIVNQIVDLNDLLCVIAGFSNSADCPGGDIMPCSGPDGQIDIGDILGALAAFEGSPSCPDPCPAPG
jgi:hypothetical protein